MTAPDADDAVEQPQPLPVNRVAGPLDALHIMTERDALKANSALERLLAADDVEHEMVHQFTTAKPLEHPVAFGAAHRTFVRSLEVYDRNARRKPSGLPAGPLRAIVTPLVGLMSSTIMRMYLRRIVTEVRRLYVMREANSPVGSREHRLLVTARRQLDQISTGMAGKGFALPAFLLGGAALSAVASVISDLLHSGWGRIALLAIILLLTIGAFWCILMAAAVTRRRTKAVIDQPLDALWRTIGGAGVPPPDPSRVFVAVATTLLIIGWIIAPAIAAILGQVL